MCYHVKPLEGTFNSPLLRSLYVKLSINVMFEELWYPPIMRPKWAPKIIPITFVLFGGSTRNYQDTAPGSAKLGATRNMKIIFKLLQHCP